MSWYTGILDGKGDVWGVRIPDLPGCYGGGATAEAAIADTRSAAREWIAHQTSRSQAVPKPRSIEDVVRELDHANNEVAVVFTLSPKRERRSVQAGKTSDPSEFGPPIAKSKSANANPEAIGDEAFSKRAAFSSKPRKKS